MAWLSKARAAWSVRRSWALSLALSISLLGYGACSALAAPNNEANKDRLDNTVRFLQSAQNSDGGFSANGNVGEASDPEFSAWAAIGLAAAGINPENQARPGDESAYGYLADHAGELKFTTDFERVLLVVDAAGTAPQDFGGVNLIQAILHRQLPEGDFFHEEGNRSPGINDTIFAILALSPSQEPSAQEAIKRAVNWLEGEQNSDGSWPSSCPRTQPGCVHNGEDPQGEVDMTAAAVEALNAAGMHDTEAQRNAFQYLHKAQNRDGGFPEFTKTATEETRPESDTASTSWTVQAIWSAGENPETWTQPGSGKEPLDYLESMQHEDGSIQFAASSDAYPVWMTAYAAPAFSGQPLPPPVVPLDVPSAAPAGGGGGVIAGGGGDGAPLFSRPQPQSTGHTPGGARQLHRRRATKQSARHAREPKLRRRAAALALATPAAGKRAASAGDAKHRGTGSGSAPPLVTGLLIDAADRSPEQTPIEPGAPGLRSASATGNQRSWLAIAIGGLIVVLILAGSLLELRRPQVVL
jgi:hypothetical protein